jgi:hypothetical protein
VFVEGLNPLPMEKGKKGGTIFGSNLYPDAIIVTDDGHKTAVLLFVSTLGFKYQKARLFLLWEFEGLCSGVI